MKLNDLTTGEVWEAVRHHKLKNRYEVSTLGRVRSTAGEGTDVGRIIHPWTTRGYRQVALCAGGVEYRFYVHRLVAKAFIPNPFRKPEVNHLSADKTDNSVGNLAWATKKENEEHAVRLGLKAHGEQSNLAKLKSDQVVEIRREMAGQKGRTRADKVRELATRYGVSRGTINCIARGRTWKHYPPNQQYEAPVAVGGQLGGSGQDALQGDNAIVTLGNRMTCTEFVA